MAKKLTKIYVLKHPRTLKIRWVGKTILSLSERLNSHIQSSKIEKYKIGCGNWIRKLLKNNLKPKISLIEETYNYIEREKYWIRFYKKKGFRLTNISDGGDNHKGFKVSPKTLIKMRKILKGKPKPPRTKLHCANLSKATIGRIISKEQRKNISNTLTGHKHSKETKLLLKLQRKNISTETRLKLSISAKKDWENRKRNKHAGRSK